MDLHYDDSVSNCRSVSYECLTMILARVLVLHILALLYYWCMKTQKCKTEPGQSTPCPSRSPPVRNPGLPTLNCGEPLSNWMGEPGHRSSTCRSPTIWDQRLPMGSRVSTNAVKGMSNQQGERCVRVLALRDLFNVSVQKSRGQSIYSVAVI